MSRRSSTSSHIPVPRNLFNSDGGRKRSASIARLSQMSNTASSLKPTRRSSSVENKQNPGRLSRPNSPNRLSKGTTPLNPPKRGRQSSAQKITPFSDRPSQSSSKGGASSIKRSVEKKSIQKLSTDVSWVAWQYSKVKGFILNSGLFDTSIVTESNIKPPSIKVFIYITSVLLKELFPNVIITNENYKVVITEKLKVLNYPGTLALSVLKTVNTMHVWPQVIGMFGWLIDKINLRNEVAVHLDTLDPFTRDCYQVTKACKRYVCDRYLIFNEGNHEDRNLQANESYVKSLKDILQVDPVKYEQLQADVAKNKEYSSKQDGDIQKLNEDISKIQEEKDQLQKEIDEFKERDLTLETELDGEIHHLKMKLKKVQERNAEKALRIANLEESIKTQPCTYEEKKNLYKKIETLKDDVRMKKEKMEHAQNLKLEYDAKLSDERIEIQNKVSKWNNFLMEWTIKKPQLKPLLLKETGFHQPAYLTAVKEVIQHKVALESDFTKELKVVGTKLEKEKFVHNNLELEVEALSKAIDNLTTEYTDTLEISTESEEKLRNLKVEYELVQKNIEEELKQLSEDNEVQLLKTQASILKIKKEQMQEDVSKFAQKTLAFFLDLRNQIAKDIRQMEEIKDRAIENRFRREFEKQKALLEQLERLKTTVSDK